MAGWMPVGHALMVSRQVRSRCQVAASLQERVDVLAGRPCGQKALRAISDSAARAARAWASQDVAVGVLALARLERHSPRPFAVRRVLGQLEVRQLEAYIWYSFSGEDRQRRAPEPSPAKTVLECRLVVEVFATAARKRVAMSASAVMATHAARKLPYIDAMHFHLVADALATISSHLYEKLDVLREAAAILLEQALLRFDDLSGDARVAVYECTLAHRLAGRKSRRLSRWLLSAHRSARFALKPLLDANNGIRWAKSSSYSTALQSAGVSSLGSRRTSRLLEELGMSAAGGSDGEWLQTVGRAALNQTADTYGVSNRTSCFVHCENKEEEYDIEPKVVSSGDGYTAVSDGLEAVHLRVRRDVDAEFVALSQILARYHCRCDSSGASSDCRDVNCLRSTWIHLHVSRPLCLSCVGAATQMKARGATIAISFEPTFLPEHR